MKVYGFVHRACLVRREQIRDPVFVDRKSGSEGDVRMTSLHEKAEHVGMALQGRLQEEARNHSG